MIVSVEIEVERNYYCSIIVKIIFHYSKREIPSKINKVSGERVNNYTEFLECMPACDTQMVLKTKIDVACSLLTMLNLDCKKIEHVDQEMVK